MKGLNIKNIKWIPINIKLKHHYCLFLSELFTSSHTCHPGDLSAM